MLFKKTGIRPESFKYTKDIQTVTMPAPKKVIIPMKQHIGEPCEPCVSVGSHVFIGDIIGQSKRSFSVPIHSSISGTVTKSKKITTLDGSICDCLIIESDGKMEISKKITPYKIKNKTDLINATKSCGLVGLGGSGFPTHIKMNISGKKHINTLIIDAAECEPFITSDYRAIIEDTSYILKGIIIIKDILNIKNAVICIENDKPKAIKLLKRHIEGQNLPIDIKILKATYPQGAEKILIYNVTSKRMQPYQLPIDLGCLVLNVSTIDYLAKYIETGLPLVSKRITVAGSAVNKPLNLSAPIGTPIKDIINFCKGYKGLPRKILIGGPMMGIAIFDDNFPILKQCNAILAFNQKDATLNAPSKCIRCGKCVEACPMNLMPVLLEKQIKLKDINKIQKLGISNCIECGCCSYVCPASRHLVQTIKLGKDLIKRKAR